MDVETVEWLSTKAAAVRLGVTPRTLYSFIDKGDVLDVSSTCHLSVSSVRCCP